MKKQDCFVQLVLDSTKPDGINVIHIPQRDVAAENMGLLRIGNNWFTPETVAKYIFRLISSEDINFAVNFFSEYPDDEKRAILPELEKIHAVIAAQHFEPLLEDQSESVHMDEAEVVHAHEAALVVA